MLLSGPVWMSPGFEPGRGDVGLWPVLGGGAASGLTGSGFSVNASLVPCSVPQVLLCWCCAGSLDRARVAASLGHLARSVSGPLVVVCLVGGAVVSLVVLVTVPQPCASPAACAGVCCGACSPTWRRCGSVAGPPSQEGCRK